MFENIRRRGVLAVVGIAAFGACKSYEPKPLDARAADAAFLERRLPAAEPAGADSAPSRYDPGDGLSLAEAEITALLLNAELRVARLRADEALAAADQAGLWEDPRLGIDFARILASVPEPWLGGATLGITLPISGRLAREKDVATAEHRVALARLAVEEWRLLVELRRAWCETTAHREREAAARAGAADLDRVVAVAARLEGAGELPRVEARLLSIERAELGAQAAVEAARVEEGHLRIKELLGIPPRLEVAFEDLAFTETRPAPSEATTESVSRHPRVRLAAAEYESAERTLAREIAAQYPDIVVGPGGASEDGDARFLFGIQLPLPLWNANARAVAIAERARETARAVYETEREAIHRSFESARVRAEAAAAAQTTVANELLKALDEQLADAAKLADLGRVDVVLWLETVTRRHEARRSLIDARLALALARVDQRSLEFVGGLTAPGERP